MVLEVIFETKHKIIPQRFVITDIMFVPPKVSYSKKVIGISTYADKLIVCYHRLTNKI